MFSRLKVTKKLIVTALIPVYQDANPDYVKLDTKTSIAMAEKKIKEREKETGMDRLYMMFSTDEFGEPSPELVNILQAMMLSIVVGGGVGGFVYSRVAFLNFVENNDATKFTHHMDAKQKLQDKVTVGFGKGAWKWGWRLTMFTGTYTLVTNTVSVYRGKSGILEHVLAGSAAGALYKMNIGLRGIVVGSCLGAVLGTFCGLATWGILKLTGTTMEDVRRTGAWVKKSRQEPLMTAIAERIKMDDGPAAAEHDARVGKITLNLDDIKIEEPKPSKQNVGKSENPSQKL